ncbi:uncharacterized protein LY89DRAFT_130604 [Mollisia scopiformis]|uniref:Uncharacterized protein n=1 Tax=Mollisia scopiformis TaxID=149040 RepID=A0A194X1S6_MOLSC|nr:uncharacterized protein LY89DRAFT_130604 [Mollisia scopiformis]KUJ14153.1 hypothetical protein LY89DRAFT_130604 [Mollisia scopiformis]
MSATSAAPLSSIEHRDLRSERLGYKRDKEHNQKWSNGQRPSAGVRINWDNEFIGGSEQQRMKVRPMKQWTSTDHKSHANKVPKPHGHYDQTRTLHKADALVDANDHTISALSKSLLELLPQHVNNTHSPIQTAIRATDAEILYSFDNKGPSPGVAGRNVDLGGLVELAEKKWVAEQTDKIVKGEYEVLDNEGETTVLASKKKKSPKQRATIVKSEPSNIKSLANDEDDGFELI